MYFNPLAITAVFAICAYYILAWTIAGRDPKPGPIVIQYNPPEGFSPAMLRYVWRENFDDRTFWAAVLSLVSKGLAKMTQESGVAVLRPVRGRDDSSDLPDEEVILLRELNGHHRAKGMRMTLLDEDTSVVVIRMSERLRNAAEGRWFRLNREYVVAGALLSIAAVFVAIMPRSASEWLTMAVSLALMAPGGFYLLLLILRIRDLGRAVHGKFDGVVLRRVALLLAFTVPCLASLVLGSVVLGGTWGPQLLLATAILIVLNLCFLHLMPIRTAEGQKLLDEIEGFRGFLSSVERFAMDRSDAPGRNPGEYEKYLPYAVALEVEQAWADRFVALASTYHEPELSLGAESVYLGMWNGKPVQIMYRPEPTRRGGV